jgi:hypothetical protein
MKAGAEAILSDPTRILTGQFTAYKVVGGKLETAEIRISSDSDDPRFHVVYEVDSTKNRFLRGDDTPGDNQGASAANVSPERLQEARDSIQKLEEFRAALEQEKRLYEQQQGTQSGESIK